MVRATMIIASALLLSACGGNASDRCIEDAYEDYLVKKDRSKRDSSLERMASYDFARSAFANDVSECQIRNGDPSDAKQALDYAEKVRDDELW